jgi:hypothetical protein
VSAQQHLIVLVDALGWLTVERTGFLGELLPYRRKLETVFGYSSTAVPSLLTGALPEEHGHWFLFRRALGRRSPFSHAGWIDRLPGNLGARWRVRQRLQEHWRRSVGIRGYFSIYNVPLGVLAELEPVEMEDTWGPGAFPETPSLIDHLDRRGQPYFLSDWREPDADKLAKARAAAGPSGPRTLVLYLTEIDGAQHRWGSEHPELDRALVTLEKSLGGLAERLAERGPLTISLFSDHGMTDVTAHHDLMGALAAEGLVRGRDYRGFFDSTVARFWSVRDMQTLHRALDGISWGTRLDEATLADWGCRFPDGAYGETFFLADPGVLILPSDMGATPIAGMHGYTPAHPTSDACFLADREVELGSDRITAVLPALLERMGMSG